MDNPQDVCWVYMTAGSREEAARIGRELVTRRLAACVNILGPISSIYTWQGELAEDEEIAFVAKAPHENLTALADAVKALHSYETPCVVALPVAGGSPEFLAWVRAACR